MQLFLNHLHVYEFRDKTRRNTVMKIVLRFVNVFYAKFFLGNDQTDTEQLTYLVDPNIPKLMI